MGRSFVTPPPCDSDVRRRGVKRPSELKDDKRRRNNLAAKQSRDARRVREHQIALRLSLLEEENSTLRAHVALYRQERLRLRALLGARDEHIDPTSTTHPTSTTPD